MDSTKNQSNLKFAILKELEPKKGKGKVISLQLKQYKIMYAIHLNRINLSNINVS